MSMDRAEAAFKTATERHVGNTHRQANEETAVAQIRNRITDSFQPTELRAEQDNQPPALVALRHRIIAAFSRTERPFDTLDRSSELAALKGALESQRRPQRASKQKHLLEYAISQLLIERQQLFLKNEFTEGFGRIEAWTLSIAFLALVLLNAINFLWGLPLLALSICRAWHLDRQCRRRDRKIEEIDALIERIEHVP
jgi:hypothetical protein